MRETPLDFRELKDNPQETEMKTINADYICGFVDGEGCFYILNTKRIACEFQVSQKERLVLDEMQKFFGCGYVKRKYDKSNTYVYLVKDISSLSEKIVPFFRTHPLIIKHKQFERFSEAVEMQSKKLVVRITSDTL